MSDDLKDKVRAQFGAATDGYATSDVHARGESLGVLVELTRPRPEWDVLDVAAGAGHTAFTFAPHVHRVTATDLTPGMLATTAALAATKGLTNVTASTADAEDLPFGDNAFDLVTCRLALHHFPEPGRFLAEAARVLKPGGLLGLTDNYTVEDPEAALYYNAYEKLRDPSHFRVYSLAGIAKLLEGALFTVEATRELTKEFEFHAWADRQHVSDADKETLQQMLREIPPALQPLFAPRWADGTLYFHLWEAVVVGRRSETDEMAS